MINKLNENAKNDWLKIVKKHKRKQKGLPALSNLNTDAGNVEHNISMFNSMTSAEGCVCESINGKQETIELVYPELTFYDANDDEITTEWIFDVDKDDLYTYIFEDCITEEDFPEAFEDSFNPNNSKDWKKFTDWLDYNFEGVYNKYQQSILDRWEDAAIEDATYRYDPDNYVDWDSMPGGHDYNNDKQFDDNFDMSTRTLL